jgi:hypothetical protein
MRQNIGRVRRQMAEDRGRIEGSAFTFCPLSSVVCPLNRDRGESHDSSPPTPPDIRVPYPAVRRIERTPAPAEGVAAEVWEPHNREGASVPALPGCQASPFSVDVQDGQYRLSAAWRLRVVRIYSLLPTVRAFGRIAPPTMPSADFCVAVRSPCDDLSLVAETQRRSPEVRPTAFAARPPDLPPRPLMTMDFAIACSLVRPGRPRYPVFVHRAAALLHASFRPCLAAAALALR